MVRPMIPKKIFFLWFTSKENKELFLFITATLIINFHLIINQLLTKSFRLCNTR
jgi:hypothetical protein